MKKETKKKSSRKLIIGGSLIFASAILLSTGFATWIIGSQQQSTEGKTKVNVDTAQNNSVVLSGSIAESDTLTICETTSTENWLTVDNSSMTADFTVAITNVKITAGSDWINSHTINSIDITIKDSVAADTDKGIAAYTNPNKTTTNKIGTTFRSGSSWSYLALSDGSGAVDTYSYTVDSSKTFSGNDLDLGTISATFTWGDYFDNKAPTAYYNGLHNTGVTSTEDGTTKLEDAQACIDELNAMHTALNGKEITLVLTINASEKASSN